ncbi:DUF6510 family protein [Microbacterium sp. NPDC058345]|uniref:DUF6510 family protein n=1 Tax=Microbacterium sp. NPDC058345 TaxID=3346455 RepID=UPI003654E2B2
MSHLDGNVLAGAAADLFAFDATAASGRCAACADVATLAQAMVYGGTMGFVVRCRNCDAVLVVIVERPGRTYLDMRGLTWMQVAGPAARPAG